MNVHDGRLLEEILESTDQRLRLAEALARPGPAAREIAIDPDQQVVLAGHRGAGKSSLLPLIGRWLGRPTLDLDEEIARREKRDLRSWISADLAGFRRAERAAFISIARGQVVAVGGGFLLLNADLLAGHLTVLVPISFETYRERMLTDSTRPRLLPALPLEEEIERIYAERERLHAMAEVIPLVDFLRATRVKSGAQR